MSHPGQRLSGKDQPAEQHRDVLPIIRDREPQRLISPGTPVEDSIVVDEARMPGLDQASTMLDDAGAIVGDRQFIQRLASKLVFGPCGHVAAVHAHPKAQRLAQHVEQHDVAKDIREIDGIDVASSREAPGALLLHPIVVQTTEAWLSNISR